MKFRIDLDGTNFSGSQTFECDADTKKDAAEKFKKGDCDFILSEIEVLDSAPVLLTDIYEA